MKRRIFNTLWRTVQFLEKGLGSIIDNVHFVGLKIMLLTAILLALHFYTTTPLWIMLGIFALLFWCFEVMFFWMLFLDFVMMFISHKMDV